MRTFIVILLLAAAPLAGALPLPQVAVSPPEGVTTGETAAVRYTLHWPAEVAPPIVLPPELPAVPGAEVRPGAMEVRSDAEGTTVTFEMSVVAALPGTVTVPALTFAYAPPEAWTDLAESESAPLELASAPAVEYAVSAPVPWPLVAGAAAALGVLLLAAAALSVWYRRRKARPAPATPRTRAQRAVHDARQYRLDGDYYAAYGALNAAVTVLPEIDESLRTRLAKRRDAVGYQGAAPNEDEFADDLRAVELAIAQTKPGVNG